MKIKTVFHLMVEAPFFLILWMLIKHSDKYSSECLKMFLKAVKIPLETMKKTSFETEMKIKVFFLIIKVNSVSSAGEIYFGNYLYKISLENFNKTIYKSKKE